MNTKTKLASNKSVDLGEHFFSIYFFIWTKSWVWLCTVQKQNQKKKTNPWHNSPAADLSALSITSSKMQSGCHLSLCIFNFIHQSLSVGRWLIKSVRSWSEDNPPIRVFSIFAASVCVKSAALPSVRSHSLSISRMSADDAEPSDDDFRRRVVKKKKKNPASAVERLFTCFEFPLPFSVFSRFLPWPNFQRVAHILLLRASSVMSYKLL